MKILLQTAIHPPIFLIRIAVGSIFLSEGIQKFLFPGELGTGRFTKIGIPYPEFFGPFVGTIEMVCGLMILIGCFTRLFSVPLIIIMLVAITTTKIVNIPADGFWETAHGARTDFSMLSSSIFLFISGADKGSVDEYFIFKKNNPMNSTLSSTIKKPSFKEATLFWLKLGFISFGGPAGQIAIMHEFLVDQKKWISDSKFLHALNYCMLLPGPEAQQLATYIGWLLHGVKGGLVAGILFVLPSVFILLGLSSVYVVYGTIPWVYALFYGLKAAVVAIVILALIKIGKKSLLTPFHYAIAALSFIGIYFFNIPFPYIILATILIGWMGQKIMPGVFAAKGEKDKKITNEDNYYLNSHSIVPGTGFSWPRLVKQIAICIVLWLLPFVLFYLFTEEFTFWRSLSLFFTKAAFVTFGGAYAVLPYVAQVTVEQLHWLSKYEMIDGLALGETTPGPLIMVLAFVGFMAGYNHLGYSLLWGSVGLLTTTFYTFLPCFLFIFAGAPIIESTQHHTGIKAVLSVVTAAVVGVVLNLTVYFGQAVVFPEGVALNNIDYFSLIWIIISFIAMYRFKIGMITWISISALAGLLHYFLL